MRRLGVLLLIALAALVAVILGWPLRAPVAAPRPPASDYAEALARVDGLRALDTLTLHAGCGTELLAHGARAPRAVVLIHGFTNCPLQFHALGESLFAAGDNVLIPRVPHHGLADRMTTDLARLTADELAALAAESVAIARGLGDTVCVVGLSTSGVAAAWAAQTLEGVDRAVVVAPALAPHGIADWAAPLVTRLALRLPDQFAWWDKTKKTDLPGPTQCYYGIHTRAVGEAYRMAEALMRDAASTAPRARDLAIVTSEADDAVSNPRAQELARRWRAHGATVREPRFARGLAVPHDMIDPEQVGAQVATVYPVLMALIQGEGGAP